MNLTIDPGKLFGAVTPPASKSQLHRMAIAAALAQGESVIENAALSEDLFATLRGIEALGARWVFESGALRIRGMELRKPRAGGLPRFDCGGCGSALRFLIPVALAVAGGGVFTGEKRLMERPLQPYFDLFAEKGIFYSLESDVLTVRGRLSPGEYRLPGNISSQFFSGLLFALPLLEGSAVIAPTGEIESFDYVLMTLQVLDAFGIRIPASLSLPPRYYISGGAAYQSRRCTAEADWSQGAFWRAARELGHEVTVLGLEEQSAQGDRMIGEFCSRIRGGGSVSLDVSGCPDLAPPLAVMGAFMDGELHLTGAARLRLKESDRLAAIAGTLSALGGQVQAGEDSIHVFGKPTLPGGAAVDCANDHRIAMMLAIAATRCDRSVTIVGADCVKKSYPRFWDDFAALGGKIHEYSGQ